MSERISIKIDPEKLQKDLVRYAQLAIELGAADAKVIPVSDVIIDERVRAKCEYPKCSFWGTSAHCPPPRHPHPGVTRTCRQV